MEYLAIALTALLAIAVYGQHKRIRYIERDVTSFSKNQEEKLKAVKMHYKVDVSDQPRDPLIEEITRKEAYRLAEMADSKLDPKLRTAAKLAKDTGWDTIDHQDNIKMLRVARQRGSEVVKVNIYYGKKTGAQTYTVATALKHPTKGKTQLFRKHVTLEELKGILQNPRAHSGKGYYKKS